MIDETATGTFAVTSTEAEADVTNPLMQFADVHRCHCTAMLFMLIS